MARSIFRVDRLNREIHERLWLPIAVDRAEVTYLAGELRNRVDRFCTEVSLEAISVRRVLTRRRRPWGSESPSRGVYLNRRRVMLRWRICFGISGWSGSPVGGDPRAAPTGRRDGAGDSIWRQLTTRWGHSRVDADPPGGRSTSGRLAGGGDG